MKVWNEITHYAGFDWARDHHDVIIVDAGGQIVADFQIEHTAEGWQHWREQTAALGPGVAACVETSRGVVVEQLLESDVTVYPVSPASAKRYRERKVPSGNKTDRVDAWSLADALRVDGHGWKALAQEDPLLAELRLLCRDEVALIEERTALINQLQSALHEYYSSGAGSIRGLDAAERVGLPRALPDSPRPAKGGKKTVGKVPARPSAGSATDLSKTPGDLRARRRVRLRRGAYPRQESAGTGARPDVAHPPKSDRRLPDRDRKTLRRSPR